MNTIEITDAEREVLAEILKNALATLDIEIRRTDHLEFKEVLKQRRNTLQELSDKIEVTTTLSS